ncbi:transposase [Candidatus Sumerlaeota bacterium]|nr:transposase [Candidatus Sumerlaeota bacterium]
MRTILARGYDSSGKGNEGIDPVVLFKMLILEQVYNLSDVQVSAEAGDRPGHPQGPPFRSNVGLDSNRETLIASGT